MPVHFDSAATFPRNTDAQLQERNRRRNLSRLPTLERRVPDRITRYPLSMGYNIANESNNSDLIAIELRRLEESLLRYPSFYSHADSLYNDYYNAQSLDLSKVKMKVLKERNNVPDIKNSEIYYEEMSKAIEDKLFFFNKIGPGLIVDFGCGDGAMIKAMKDKDRGRSYVGYDICGDALGRARTNVMFNEPTQDMGSWWNTPRLNVKFTSDWTVVDAELFQFNHWGIESTLVLSSVIHEVLSYQSPEGVKKFWDRIYKSKFTYIVIRDMMPSRNIDRESNKEIVERIRDRYASDLIGHANLREFEEHWGSIDNEKNLVHFLLKYRFTDNWSREVKENYIPTFFENFMASIPVTYNPIHVRKYSHAFTKKKIKEDFDVTFDVETHVDIILKKENFSGDAVNP